MATVSFAIEPFSMPWMNAPTNPGTTIWKMADFPDGVVVLEAFKLDCGYCKANAPLVDQLAAKWDKVDKRVKVLDIGQDSYDYSINQWISMFNPNHPVLKDVGRTVFYKLIQQEGVPQTFILNCKGDLVAQTYGGPWGDEEQTTIDRAIKSALQTDCSRD